jgi:hypothetical protein
MVPLRQREKAGQARGALQPVGFQGLQFQEVISCVLKETAVDQE